MRRHRPAPVFLASSSARIEDDRATGRGLRALMDADLRRIAEVMDLRLDVPSA